METGLSDIKAAQKNVVELFEDYQPYVADYKQSPYWYSLLTKTAAIFAVWQDSLRGLEAPIRFAKYHKHLQSASDWFILAIINVEDAGELRIMTSIDRAKEEMETATDFLDKATEEFGMVELK